MEDFDDGMDELTSLQSKLHEAQNDLNEIKENLNSAKRYWGETTGLINSILCPLFVGIGQQSLSITH